jgi:hypothetical protein
LACPFNLGQALTALASNRLYDPSMQYWSAAELTFYVQEALRTWNSLTGYWRGDFTFELSQDTFYDLTQVANTLRPMTVTDDYLYQVIEAHLLEPATTAYPLTWTGTTQFTMQDLVAAVQRGRDETLGVTGCYVTQRVVAAAPGRISLPSTVIDIRRNSFEDAQGVNHYLWKSDPQAWLGYETGYTSNPTGTPRTYSVSTEPVWTFDTDVPAGVGTYNLFTVETEGSLSVNNSSLLYVPDDWSWVIKFRALSDLFGQESEPKDSARQKYCEARYQQGLRLLSIAPALLLMRVNNIPVFIDSVKAADAYQLGWDNQTPGTPKSALIDGLNLIAFNPPPAAGPYSAFATVIQNAPVVQNDSDCLNLTNDFVDVILDYAQHLAALKMGGQEFADTMPLYQRFVKQAALYTSKVGQQGPFTRELWAMSQKQEVMEPRLKEDEEAQVG